MLYHIEAAEGKKGAVLIDGKEVGAKDLGEYFFTPEAKSAYASLLQEGFSRGKKKELREAFQAELGVVATLQQQLLTIIAEGFFNLLFIGFYICDV